MMAFERIEPFGALADEYRLGTICSAIVNVQRTKESDRVYTADDFMPALRRAMPEPEPIGADMSPEELSNLIDAKVFGHVNNE